MRITKAMLEKDLEFYKRQSNDWKRLYEIEHERCLWLKQNSTSGAMSAAMIAMERISQAASDMMRLLDSAGSRKR
jgi:hypothetical protein